MISSVDLPVDLWKKDILIAGPLRRTGHGVQAGDSLGVGGDSSSVLRGSHGFDVRRSSVQIRRELADGGVDGVDSRGA